MNWRDVRWDEIDLGQRPDTAIALELGVARERVGAERRRRGIAAFVGVVLTQEGEPCRSIYEAMLDAVFHHQGVQHEHQPRVPGLPYYADFLTAAGSYVEVVGMLGYSKYRDKWEKKHRAYDALALPLEVYEPGSIRWLYARYGLPLNFRDRRCIDCGRQNHDLVQGRCRYPCYMRWWRTQHAESHRCEGCGKTYERVGKGRYCSRECYWASMVGVPFPHRRRTISEDQQALF